MKFPRIFCVALFLVSAWIPALHGLDKQPSAVYHARRVALAQKLNGGVAVLFAAEEPQLDFDPYRQDSDFYYLTGWNEPGAALLIVADAPQAKPPRTYSETMFLPTRNLRLEKYTGEKLGAASPGAIEATGVDAVKPMVELPTLLNALIENDNSLFLHLYSQPAAPQAKALLGFLGVTLGRNEPVPAADAGTEIMPLRQVKDAGEIELLKKANEASIAAQFAMISAVKPGVTERAIAGKMEDVWLGHGCERPAYFPIVGTGINSTILHYSEVSKTIADGDLVLVDAACEYSMYASDITRTVPANGRFTARQREIYDIVLGAQQAAIGAFVAGKSKINGNPRDPDALDTAAYNYINTHGKSLDGQPLGKYWLHGLGHMVGIDVHDPGNYPVVLKPGMVFTIEPGVYIPEEKIGVRIECDFLVEPDGKLVDLDAALPHTADEVEAAMRAR